MIAYFIIILLTYIFNNIKYKIGMLIAYFIIIIFIIYISIIYYYNNNYIYSYFYNGFEIKKWREEQVNSFCLSSVKKQKQNKKELLSPFYYLCLVFY